MRPSSLRNVTLVNAPAPPFELTFELNSPVRSTFQSSPAGGSSEHPISAIRCGFARATFESIPAQPETATAGLPAAALSVADATAKADSFARYNPNSARGRVRVSITAYMIARADFTRSGIKATPIPPSPSLNSGGQFRGGPIG